MLRLPTHVQFEITDVCNLRCKHCYHFDTDKMPKSNDLDDVKIIQLVQKMVDSKIYSLVITGGEPLARPSITLKVAEIAKTAGMFVSINTNLLLLNSEIVARLEKIEVNSLFFAKQCLNIRMLNIETGWSCGEPLNSHGRHIRGSTSDKLMVNRGYHHINHARNARV